MARDARFNDDGFTTTRQGVDNRRVRRAAQTRAYQRWEQELRRKYRSVRPENRPKSGPEDNLDVEGLATREDFLRLQELERQELMKAVGARGISE